MIDERVTDLEIKLSYQEDAIETLNRVVLEQAARIAVLEKRLEEAIARQGASDEHGPGDPLDERPPHY